MRNSSHCCIGGTSSSELASRATLLDSAITANVCLSNQHLQGKLAVHSPCHSDDHFLDAHAPSPPLDDTTPGQIRVEAEMSVNSEMYLAVAHQCPSRGKALCPCT